MKIMKTLVKAMKKLLDRKQSRTLADKKEEKRKENFKRKQEARKIKRAMQKEKKEKKFLVNQKAHKKKALDAGREHVPWAKSLAKVSQILSAASSEAKDAKKIATSAKKESREAKKESREAKEDVKQGRADQTQFMIKYDCVMIKYDCELQKVKDILHIFDEDAEDVCMEHSPSPGREKACDREVGTPPCATPPRQRHARYLQQNGNPLLNAGSYTKEERVRKGLATWNEGTSNDK